MEEEWIPFIVITLGAIAVIGNKQFGEIVSNSFPGSRLEGRPHAALVIWNRIIALVVGCALIAGGIYAFFAIHA